MLLLVADLGPVFAYPHVVMSYYLYPINHEAQSIEEKSIVSPECRRIQESYKE